MSDTPGEAPEAQAVSDEEVEQDIEQILASRVLTNEQKMKILYFVLGTLEGLHTNLDKISEHEPTERNLRDPIDHNLEQAQVSLEVASFRVHQMMTHVKHRLDAAAQEDSGE